MAGVWSKRIFASLIFLVCSSQAFAGPWSEWWESLGSYTVVFNPQDLAGFRVHHQRDPNSVNRYEGLPSLRGVTPRTSAFDLIFAHQYWWYEHNVYNMVISRETLAHAKRLHVEKALVVEPESALDLKLKALLARSDVLERKAWFEFALEKFINFNQEYFNRELADFQPRVFIIKRKHVPMHEPSVSFDWFHKIWHYKIVVEPEIGKSFYDYAQSHDVHSLPHPALITTRTNAIDLLFSPEYWWYPLNIYYTHVGRDTVEEVSEVVRRNLPDYLEQEARMLLQRSDVTGARSKIMAYVKAVIETGRGERKILWLNKDEPTYHTPVDPFDQCHIPFNP